MEKNYFKHKTVWITLAAVIAVMALIFFFSSQTKDESSDTSGVIVDLYIDWFVPDFDEMTDDAQDAVLKNLSHTIRKLAHFTEYAVLGFALTLHIHELKDKLNVRLNKLWSVIIGVLYAASDEFHQYFVPGRSMQLKDIAIDSTGILTGFVIISCILAALKNKGKKIC